MRVREKKRTKRRNRAANIAILLALLGVFCGCMRAEEAPKDTPTPAAAEQSPAPIRSATPEPTPTPAQEPEPTPIPEPTPEPEPQREAWLLSFAGDCTIGTLHEWQDNPWITSMLDVMDGDWSYPFSGVADVFSADDFTLVNLEGTFTDRTEPVEKAYRFRAPPEAAQTLLSGGVEAVTLANNHSGDYGAEGLQDTKDTLDALGVLWADGGYPIVTQLPDDGPWLGVIVFNCVEGETYPGDVDGILRRMEPAYAYCRDEDCELVIAYLHWGWEYREEPEDWVIEIAHRLAELGCDMVLGSHPHILQRTELYEGVPIAYSLGNFCFGGNSGPEDMDSVILQQTVLRTEEGFALGETAFLPCRISSTPHHNDFQPVLYTPEEPDYARVLHKLGVRD